MNKRIVIDPGHGGDDPGAIGNGMKEKDYTLLISKYMYDRFKELGIPVTLTRDDDITLSPTERVSRVLNAYGNDKDVIVVSNHLNAGGGDGAEVIYALRNDAVLPNKILDNLKLAGQNIRKSYQRKLPTDPSKDYYFMLRNTPDTQSIIIEYGFIDSSGDDAKQIKNNWQKYAEAAVKAIAEYAGYNYNNKTGDNYYVVKSGDTLYSIALNNKTTINEIKQLNNLDSNILSIGQILLLPNPKTEELDSNNYIVKKGDTLYQIANKYATTVDELKKINNLISNVISIGQKLILPSNLYNVVSGDTLYSIARRFNTTVDELKRINNLTNNLLSIGQVLKIK